MKNKTGDGLEILQTEFGEDEELQGLLAEEGVTAQIARAIYDARRAAGLTQQELAELVGTQQPVIARLEDNDYDGHTLAMLGRIARALKLRAEFRFVSPDEKAESAQSSVWRSSVLTNKTLTSEQMEVLLQLLGYQPFPSKGPQRVFGNRDFDAVQFLPAVGKEPYARVEHLITLRKISVEKGIVDEETFEDLLEKARQHQTEPGANHNSDSSPNSG